MTPLELAIIALILWVLEKLLNDSQALFHL